MPVIDSISTIINTNRPTSVKPSIGSQQTHHGTSKLSATVSRMPNIQGM